MKTILLLLAALAFWIPAFADSVPLPLGVDCAQYSLCNDYTTIEVELGGAGTNTWADVVELHPVVGLDGSEWMTFLWPDGAVGLSTSLTWQPDPADPLLIDPPSVATPEPSTFVLLSAGLILLWKLRPVIGTA